MQNQKCVHVYFSMLDTKDDILKNLVVKKQWTPLTFETFLKIAYFLLHTKKEAHTGFEQNESK